MSEVLRYQSPQVQREITARVGLLIFLAAWIMLFAGLLFAYGDLRLEAAEWPPPGLPALPRALPFAMALVLLASSGVLQLGLWRLRRGRPLELAAALVVALLLGLWSLGLQGALSRRVLLLGLGPRAGGYASFFWGLTLWHALQILVGLGGLLSLLVQTLDGRCGPTHTLGARFWVLFWQLVTASWLVIATAVFWI